jgi:hypothetical protein
MKKICIQVIFQPWQGFLGVPAKFHLPSIDQEIEFEA